MIEKSSFWNSIKTIKKSFVLYGSILIGFTLWMLLLDTHSWNIHSELNEEIEKLELEKEALTKVIEKDRNTIKQLGNEDSLERCAREQYGHKKKNETIFIIEPIDTLPKN